MLSRYRYVVLKTVASWEIIESMFCGKELSPQKLQNSTILFSTEMQIVCEYNLYSTIKKQIFVYISFFPQKLADLFVYYIIFTDNLCTAYRLLSLTFFVDLSIIILLIYLYLFLYIYHIFSLFCAT